MRLTESEAYKEKVEFAEVWRPPSPLTKRYFRAQIPNPQAPFPISHVTAAWRGACSSKGPQGPAFLGSIQLRHSVS